MRNANRVYAGGTVQADTSMDNDLLEQICRDLEGTSEMPDLTVTAFLLLPNALREFLRWIVLSRAVTCEQVAAYLGETEEKARFLVSRLEALELIERLPICGMVRYRVCLSPRRLIPPPELLNPA